MPSQKMINQRDMVSDSTLLSGLSRPVRLADMESQLTVYMKRVPPLKSAMMAHNWRVDYAISLEIPEYQH